MHSLLASKSTWRETSEILSHKLRRRIYAIDARNHGDSLHTKEHTVEHMVQDLLKFMEDHRIPKALLFGHGMGGRTVIYFTLKYPESVARGVILDLSPLSVPRTRRHMAKVLFAMKYAIALNTTQGREDIEEKLNFVAGRPELLNFIMDNFRTQESGTFCWAVNVETLLQNFKELGTVMPYIKNMPPFQGPTLFFSDNYAKFITVDSWRLLNVLFPNSELQWFNVENLTYIHQSQRFLDAVIEFLNKEQD